MPTVANIGVSVTARTNKFRKGMKNAQSSVRQFGASVANIGKRIAQFGVVMGGVAVAATALMVKKQLAAVDATSKLADSLGITTEGLTALQHAAEITGVGTEGMNKAMEQFVRRLGEAQTGTGEAKDVLDAFGLSAVDLSRDPVEAFRTVSDAINKMPDAASRAEAAYGLFGRQGVKLTNTMALGSAGLAEMAEEASKLGLTFDRETGAKIEAANDSFTRMQGVITGAARSIAVNLAPFLTEIANRFTAAATKGEGLGVKVSRGFEAILRATAKAADFLELFKAGFQGLRGVAGIALLGIIKPLEFLIKKLEETINFLADVTGAFDRVEFASSVGNLADAITLETEEAFENAAKSFAKFQSGASQTAITKFFDGIKSKADDAAKEVAKTVADRLQIQDVAAGTISLARAVKTKATAVKTATASAIVLSRTVLGGAAGAKKQLVRDPDVLTVLKKIEVAVRTKGGVQLLTS